MRTSDQKSLGIRIRMSGFSSMLLNKVTLVTIETMFHDLSKRGLEETLKRIPFKNVLIFSDKTILPGAEHVKIKHGDMNSYVNLLFKGILEYTNTSHIIFQQWDSMIHDSTMWDDRYLNYDFIGAPWGDREEGKNIGNGGFSLRSIRLYEKLQKSDYKLDDPEFGLQEDNYIGIKYRTDLENLGIKFASTEVARKFSTEYEYCSSPCMAHHGLWCAVKYMPSDVVKYFIRNIPDDALVHVWARNHRFKTTIKLLKLYNYQYLIVEQYDRIFNARKNFFKYLNKEYTKEDFDKELNDADYIKY